jgi:hypothetical protein
MPAELAKGMIKRDEMMGEIMNKFVSLCEM